MVNVHITYTCLRCLIWPIILACVGVQFSSYSTTVTTREGHVLRMCFGFDPCRLYGWHWQRCPPDYIGPCRRSRTVDYLRFQRNGLKLTLPWMPCFRGYVITFFVQIDDVTVFDAEKDVLSFQISSLSAQKMQISVGLSEICLSLSVNNMII